MPMQDCPNDLPLVSVLMPAYNRGDLIQASIQGLLNQTYPNIELLILDDGSTDDTVAKVEALRGACEARFTAFKFLRNERNRDLICAMNTLSAEISGKYVMRNDSDDIALPECIAKEVAFLETHPECVLVAVDSAIIDVNGTYVGWTAERNICPLEMATTKTLGEYLSLTERGESFGTYEELVKDNHVPGTSMYVTAAWKSALPFTEEAPLEDWYVMLQLAKLGKIAYLDEVLYAYRWHAGNTTKLAARIRYVCAKTFDYEERLVNRLEDKHWAKLLYQNGYKTTKTLSLPPFLELYKVRSFTKSVRVLKLFGKTFEFRKRDLLKQKTEAYEPLKLQS